MKNTKKMVTAALLAAFTCIATMIIKIPTPTFGYIHLGDGLVLLCGIILGPGIGALAAGIGSMFADIFSGYMTWAPATLIIKALTACIAGLLFHKLRLNISSKANRSVRVVVLGYFLFEAGLAAFASGSFSSAALATGIVSSAAGIPFNIVQGVVGIILCLILLPVLSKINDVNEWVSK